MISHHKSNQKFRNKRIFAEKTQRRNAVSLFLADVAENACNFSSLFHIISVFLLNFVTKSKLILLWQNIG